MSGPRRRTLEYVARWMSQGYPGDIPDEVPEPLHALGLAPSYKAVALALLRNDLPLLSLGFAPIQSRHYGIIKRAELGLPPLAQLELWPIHADAPLLNEVECRQVDRLSRGVTVE